MKFIKSIVFVFAVALFIPNFGSSPKSGGKSLFNSQQKAGAEAASGIFALLAQAPQVSGAAVPQAAGSGAAAGSAASVGASAAAPAASHQDEVDLKAQEEHEEEIAHKFQMSQQLAKTYIGLQKKTVLFETNQPVDFGQFHAEYTKLNDHANRKSGASRGLGSPLGPKGLLDACAGFYSTYNHMKAFALLSAKYKVTLSPQS